MADTPAQVYCSGCGTEISPGLLACPVCRKLVHGARLTSLAQQAEQAQAGGDVSTALARWREALDLLPAGSTQHQAVLDRIGPLSSQAGALNNEYERQKIERHPFFKRLGKWALALGPAAALLWKLKFALIFLLTKGKLLLLGLTKASTFLSMLLSFGVYWTVFGWRFAAGLIGSIYIHEMGHVAELQRFGIKASAPMFIPGFGALVRLKQYPANRHEDARVGLAGPIWGMAAALAAWGIAAWSGSQLWNAIARVGAWINLFNLLPVWQLDGARGLRALPRSARLTVAITMGAMWMWTTDGLLAILGLVTLMQAWSSDAPSDHDHFVLIEFLGLLVILSAMLKFIPNVRGMP